MKNAIFTFESIPSRFNQSTAISTLLRQIGRSAILLAIACYGLAAHGQTGEWAWTSGSSTVDRSGGYGTLGKPSIGNVPGARSVPVSWIDKNGSFWLFGGCGYDSNGSFGELNDLWEFDPSSKMWTWMGGSKTLNQGGVYGTLGVASAKNVPGGRNSAVSWTDGSGNFWMFGGNGYDGMHGEGYLNDLWKYSPSTNEWTWVAGSSQADQLATFGTLGKAARANTPGARYLATGWIDKSGNLWLFGGYGESVYAAGMNRLNDLWRFIPSTSEWTWMGGSSTPTSAGGIPGVYGELGKPSPENIPGSRDRASGWTDGHGNLSALWRRGVRRRWEHERPERPLDILSHHARMGMDGR